MKRLKKLTLTIISLIIIIGLSGFVIKNKVQSKVKDLFKMNKSLKEEGYYMGEFEFHMLGFAYEISKGNYVKAYGNVSYYHDFLSKRENLIKIPKFSSNQEEIDFYLNLQNPKTGAFMTGSVPFCTYFSNTENIISHLEALLDSTTKPLKLKYPLFFLDSINTPEKLENYLNDISYVSWLGAKFPQTTFHFARDILSNTEPDNVLERNNIYRFSDEWKQTMLKWMYNFQDKETGLWGPKNKKTNKLLKLDISNTYSIIKKFRNNDGNDIYKEYPLQNTKELIKTTLEQLWEPLPEDSELALIHEWNLRQAKGIKMVLSRLWKDASIEKKEETKKIINRFIKVSFDKYYVKEDGAFSYYPNSKKATVDGMNNMIYKTIGALSSYKQKKYWGKPESNIKDLGIITTDSIKAKDFEILSNYPDINSWRVYTSQPDYKKLSSNVWTLIYPNNTNILDITELVPNLKKWANNTSLSTGNWKSIADIKNDLNKLNIKQPEIYRNQIPFNELNLKIKNTSIFIIGFDALQIPRFIIEFR